MPFRTLWRTWNPATIIGMMIGAVALLYSGWQAYRTVDLLSHALYANGVIVASEGHPTIRFETARGERVEFVQNGGLSRPVGTDIGVAYRPIDPAQTARATTFWAMWGDALVCLPMGLVFLLAPLFGARFEQSGRYGAAIKRRSS